MVHGGAQGSARGGELNFSVQKPLAERGWQLIIPDRPGHGRSPDPGRPDDAEADGAWVADLLEDGAHLVGHSFGGCVALAAAAKRPTAVRSLTLIEPAMHKLATSDLRVKRFVLSLLMATLFSTSAAGRAKRFMKLLGIPAEIRGHPDPEELKRVGKSLARGKIPSKATLQRELGAIKRAAVPLLVVTGGWALPSKPRRTSLRPPAVAEGPWSSPSTISRNQCLTSSIRSWRPSWKRATRTGSWDTPRGEAFDASPRSARAPHPNTRNAWISHIWPPPTLKQRRRFTDSEPSRPSARAIPSSWLSGGNAVNPRRSPAGCRRTLWAAALLFLPAGAREANAACTNNPPSSGQTVDCTGTNVVGVSAFGSTNVTVNVLSGSITTGSGSAIGLGGSSTITVAAGASVTGPNGAVVQGGNGSISVAGTVVGSSSAGASLLLAGSTFATFNISAGGSVSGPVGLNAVNSNGVNATIAGQLTGTGGTAGTLSFTDDTFLLTSTGTVTGTVDARGGTDSLVLGGATNGSFNASNIGTVAQYQNFETFVKEGTSAWTLTGSGNQTWAVTAGTLKGDTSSLTGSVTNAGTVEFSQNTNGSYGGVISSSGSLVKSGTGNVTLTGANSYGGGTTVSAGTLTGSTTSLQGNILNNGVVAFSQNLDGTYGGMISGTGALSKLGSGNVTLSGANNYSGGTTVAGGGTLTGTTTSLQGSIANTGTLIFDQATNGTFSGSLSGSGTVRKEGAGTLTITGTQPLTGQTQALGGTLLLNGSVQGNVAVVGGTFGGNAQIGGLLAFGGTVAPGNSIGTLTVNGPVAFIPGSTYAVEINAAGASDKIVATGAATLSGGTVSILPVAGSYARTTNYTILTAAGGISGAFTDSTMDTNFAFLQPSLSYSTNDVILTILNLNADPGGGGGSQVTFESVANTGNERAVARTLDDLGTSAPFYNQLIVQTTQGARAAYNALSGEVNASLPTTIIGPTAVLTSWLHDRTAGTSPSQNGGPQLISSAPLGIVSDTGTLASSFEAGGALADRGLPGVGAAAPGADELPYSAWMHAFGDLTHVSGNGDAAAIQSSGGGLFLGGDLPVGSWFRLGAATGYSHNNVSVNERSSSADLDGAHAALYATSALGPVRLRGVGTFAYQGVDTNRRVQIGTVTEHPTADYGSYVAGGLGEVGYAFDVSGLEIQPYAGCDYVWLRTNSFTEHNGGAANLQVDQATDDWPTSVLGVRLAQEFSYAGHVFRPRLDAAWGHTFGSLSPDRAAAFASSPGLPYSVSGAPLARDAARIGAGIDVVLTENVRVGIEYRGDLAPGAQNNGFGLKLGLRF